MRTQRRNRQTMYYASPTGRIPKYAKDADGNIIYDEIDGKMVPRETGEYETTYSDLVEFRGAIFSQLENALQRAYGMDNSNNYAVLVVDKGKLPELRNGARIWLYNPVNIDGYTDPATANYVVTGVLREELNEDSYYLTILD